MTDISDPPRNRLVHNERVKLNVVFLSRIGICVMIIGFIPLFLKGFSVGTVCWIIGGMVVGIGLNIAAIFHIGRLV